jgi:hypothetical protein
MLKIDTLGISDPNDDGKAPPTTLPLKMCGISDLGRPALIVNILHAQS